MADIMLRLAADERGARPVLVLQGGLEKSFADEGFSGNFSLLNIDEPETVENACRLQLAAGADCAVTNTWEATSSRLSASGLAASTADVNASGMRIASGLGFTHVLAAVGPCGIEVERGSGTAALKAQDPAWSEVARDAEPALGYSCAVEQYAEQVAVLTSEGPDGLLLAGFSQLDDLLAAIDAAKRTCDLPVLACMTFGAAAEGAAEDTAPEGAAPAPVAPAEVARTLVKAGAAAVGCAGMAVEATVEALGEMAAAVDVPLVAYPSVDGPAASAPSDADAFAELALELVRAGASLVGVWGGATPVRTGAMFAAVGGCVSVPAV